MPDTQLAAGGPEVDPSQLGPEIDPSQLAPAPTPTPSVDESQLGPVVDESQLAPPAAAAPDAAGAEVDPAHLEPDTDVTKPQSDSGWKSDPHIVTQDEVDAIAKQHGVDPADVAKAAGVYGATVIGPGDDASKILSEAPQNVTWGVASRLTGGLAQTAYHLIEAGGDEQKWGAIKDLEDLITQKKTWQSRGLEGASNLMAQSMLLGAVGKAAGAAVGPALETTGLAAKMAAKLGALLGEGATVAGQSAAEARPGEEGHDVAWSLVFLGGMHTLGAGVGKYLDAKTTAAKEAAERLANSPEVQGAVDTANQTMRANANSEMALQKAVVSPATSAEELIEHLGTEEIQQIAHLARGGGTGSLEAAQAAHAADEMTVRELDGYDPPDKDTDSEAHGTIVADTDADTELMNNPALIFPESPNDEMARIGLHMADPGTPAADAEAAYSYVEATREKLHAAIGAGGSDPANLQEALADPTRGPDLVARRFLDLRKAEYTMSAIRDAGLDMTTGAGRDLQFGGIRNVGAFFSDARHVYAAIDNRYGTELTPLLDRVVRNYNGYTLALQEANEARKPLLEATMKLADSTTQSGRQFIDSMYGALNDGHFSLGEYSPEQVQVLRGWRDHFHELANKAETLHTQFPDLDITPVTVARLTAGPENSYVPHYVKGGPDFVAAMRAEMRDTGLSSGAQIFEAASRGDERALGLVRGLELWGRGDITSTKTATEALGKLLSLTREGEQINTSARSLFARSGEIPDFLLEKDVQKLASSWTQNTYRHLFLRNPLAELAIMGGHLNEINPAAGKYITDHVMDIAGLRKGTLATWISDKKAKWISHALDAAERTSSPAGKAWWGLVAHMDDISNSIFSNMYAGYLGLRPDATLRYMAQPFFTATPHLAATEPVDALRRINGAYKKAVQTFANAETRGAIREEITRAGRLPAEQAFEAQQYLKTGLEAGGVGGFLSKAQGASDAVNHFSMGMFRAADLVGRVVTKHLAEGIIEDAAELMAHEHAGVEIPADVAKRGRTAAIAIDQASPGYRSLIQRSLREGDVDGARDAMTQFMTSHTQQDYNRIAMSEFGRSMGGIFSMFSKWPTSVLGECLGTLDANAIHKPMSGANTRILTKYLAPLAAAYWLNDQVWQPFQDEDSDASHFGKLIAGKDLTGWVPGDSLRSIFTGGLAHTPPGADVLKEIGAGAVSGDPSRALAAAADLTVSGMPFGVLVKKLMLEWGPAFAGEAPVNLRREVETGTRDGIVNPARWALGFDPVDRTPHNK